MCSSILGGMVNDPALMVLPLDGHRVQGATASSTRRLTHGML
jgi:hypothetical protein